ncbi:MAG: Protein of unknown function (DUF3584) [Phormidium sp. OSCR]|nr:MAG: Protein of unknown function (DUF3584) [Phormidium sp. OSCR]
MSQIKCPVCDTTNELVPAEVKQCKSCGFPLIDEFNNTAFLSCLHHDISEWSRHLWNNLKERDKKIEDLRTELAQLKENLGQTSQAAQQDDSVIEASQPEIGRENIDDLWKQFEPYVNQEIKKQQDALAENFRKDLKQMRAEIEKYIEARLKDQTHIDSPDQTQRGHDSGSSETSSDTLSSLKPDRIDVDTNIPSSKVTLSSEGSQSHGWSWLYESKTDDVIVVSPDNIKEMRAKDVPILLTQQTRGNYWIIRDPSSSRLCLAPQPKISFNEHNIEFTKKIFECQNYDDLKRQRFEVIKPAFVKQLETEEKWEIQEKGELVFISKT